MSQLVIRRAEPEDKEAILAIGEIIYGGCDYMDAFYDEVFMNCPVATPYVAVYNGDIVGFLAAFIVDDGDTVVSRGGRIKPEWSRRGFYKALTQYAMRSTNASVNACTIDNTNKAISSGSFQAEYNLVLKLPTIMYDFDVNQLPKVDKDDKDGDSMAVLTKSLLQHYVTSDMHKEYLFPDNRIIVNWVPFKPVPSNIPVIWLMDEQSLRLSDVIAENGELQGLMSISTTYYCTTGVFVCQLDLYGTDCRSLKHHVACHLDFIRKQTSGNTIMMITGNQGIIPTLEETFKDYSLLKIRSSENTKYVLETQYLFEKPIAKTNEKR